MLRKLLLLAALACAVPVHADEVKPANPAMTETAAKDFAARDEKTPPIKGGIVFMGSSSIRRWTTLEKDFPQYHVVNRGFGGSEISDSVVIAEGTLVPHDPKVVVFFAGGNDIARGVAPEKVAADFQEFATRVHKALPNTVIVDISIPGAPARWSQVPKIKQANALIEAFTKTQPYLRYVDIFPLMLTADGKPRPELYVKDQIHMTPDGYAIWIKALEPVLAGLIGK